MSDEMAVCTRIRVRPDEAGRSVLDGQSKILNWLGNRLLDRATRCRDALARISSYAEDPTLPPEIRAEVLAPAWDLVMCAYSPYGLRNLVPAMKDQHPFLRLAHSSPVKNAALRLTDAIKAHVTAKREGREVGWPKYKKWSRDWHSIEYDEKKGWKVEGRTLHVSLGSRVVPDADLDAGQKRALAKRRRKDPSAVQPERLTLALPLDEAPPRGAYRIEIVKDLGEYHVVFTHKVAAARGGTAPAEFVYFDPNHSNFAYGLTSEGLAIEIDNRAGKREQNTRIDHLQVMRDRCRRRGKLIEFTREDGTLHRHWEPSRRWTKLNATLQREQKRRRDQDKTYMFSLAHAMCRTAAAIGIGDYAPEACDHGLGRTRRQRAKSNRTMNHNSLIGRFKPILSWVGWKSGRAVHVMDESGTTRTCSECDHVVPDGIAPGIKAWTCPGCGYRHIRDENAAKNGLDRLKHLVEAASGNPHSPRSGPTGPRNRVVQRCGWSFVSSGKPGGAWRMLDESTTSVNEIAPVPFRRRRPSGSAGGSGLGSGGPDRLKVDHPCSMRAWMTQFAQVRKSGQLSLRSADHDQDA